MKRQVSLTLAGALFLSFALCAQSKTKQAGKFTVSTGIGILSTYFKDGATSQVPALSLRAGYVVSKHFTVNAYLGYSSTMASPRVFDDGLFTQIQNNSIAGGLRGELRHEVTNRLEIYGGGMLGISKANISEEEVQTGRAIYRNSDEPTPYNPSPRKSTFTYSGFVGTVFFIQPKFGVYTELGYGISLLTVGITFRM